MILFLFAFLTFASTTTAPLPYTLKGQSVDAAYTQYLQKLKAGQQKIATACRRYTPRSCSVLKKEKPKDLKAGYGILPPLLPDLPYAAQDPQHGPERSYYSWPRTQGYIQRELAALDEIDQKTAVLPRFSPSDAAAVTQAMVDANAALCEAQSLIAQHIHYNWFWQKYAAGKAGRADGSGTLSSNASNANPPPFLTYSPNQKLFTLPVYTDITNKNFLKVFKDAVAREWQAGPYKVHLDIRTIKPVKHYNAATHLDHFPKDGAVLTTGSERSYETLGHAIILGPEPLHPRELAHKFGHLLGFPDFYQREYQNLGADGFEIVEIVSSNTDIMSEPQRGRVHAAHFEALLRAIQK